MIKTIRIKIENESNEKEIFNLVKNFIKLNFSINTEVDFEVSGKNETIKFDMKKYKEELEKVSHEIFEELKNKQEGLWQKEMKNLGNLQLKILE